MSILKRGEIPEKRKKNETETMLLAIKILSKKLRKIKDLEK